MNKVKHLVNFIIVLCLVAGAVLVTPAQVVHASATIWTVNTMTDEQDGSCVGDCSLRDAVLLAQPGDTINFASGGILKLTLGEIVIDKVITIVGPGVGFGGLIISGEYTSRHFDIATLGGQVKISNMLLNHGKSTAYPGGSIANSGYLILDNVWLSYNEAAAYDSYGSEHGGAIINYGTLIITNSKIYNNSASGDGGGIYNSSGSILILDNVDMQGNTAGGSGGALWASGDLTVQNSRLAANFAVNGAGLYLVLTSEVLIQASTIKGNSASGAGGAVFAFFVSQLEVIDSTISGNLIASASSSYKNGAGLYLNSSTVVIENSTISGNSGAYAGGGLYLAKDNILQLKNVTVADNTALMAGGVHVPFVNNTVTLKNTILADNTSVNTNLHDCYAENSNDVLSQGSNLVESGNCVFSAPGDIVGQDAQLNGLADNGGSTQTHSLKPNSPALDKGNDITCSATDQRGIKRPIGSHCDIGAYEYVPAWADQLWVGGVSIASDKNVVAVGRPHVGNEIASYDGFNTGSTTAYVPMLFKDAFGGSYDSALYIQNVHATNTANVTIKYYDNNGVLNCTKADTLAPLASKGYWLPSVTCDSGSLPAGWTGGVVVVASQPIVAVGRPHIGAEVMTYNGFAAGSLSTYIPMLFKGAFGGSYNAAFYIQNVHASNAANITIKYYDSNGNLNCTKADTIAPLASKGYWVPSATCDSGSLPAGWSGGVVVSSNQPIVGVGRPHIETQITTYNGFAAGGTTTSIPMLFKGAFGGSYNAAFYIQNVHATNTANVTIKYYDNNGNLNCTKTDTLAPLASKGYWVPSATCDSGSLPAGWSGGVVVTANQPIVGVGRPHIGAQVTTYNGFTGGSLNTYVPMLFKNAYGGNYNAAFYVQNTEASTASVTLNFYDSNGNLSCVRTDTIPAHATLGIWVPTVTCDP